MRASAGEIYVNPKIAVRAFYGALAKHGEAVLSERKFKITREGWVAAMFLVALQNHENSQWWMQPNPSDPPDFYVSKLYHDGGRINEDTRQVEVFEHREGSIINAIKTKIEGWNAPEFSVVCYSRVAGSISPIELAEQVKVLEPRVGSISVVAALDPNLGKHMVGQVYPAPVWMEVDLAKDVFAPDDSEIEFMGITRGAGGEPTLKPLGKKAILTYDFQLKEYEN